MKTLVCLTALILSACAVPNGYYKQEYQFKKTSSTFKNNQLETKNDDEGYYGKQGDLDGTSSPQVEQHNQHSEFVSPNVDGLGHSQTSYNDRDLTPEAERVFRNHNLNPGTTGQRSYAYSSNTNGYQGGNYGQSQYRPTTYSTQSNLGQVTQNLQYDMAAQVRDAVRYMHGQSSYGSTQMRSEDMQYLENQLKANITRQLQEALQQKYGQQTTRGASSHSLSSTSGSSGGYNPSANYDTNELNDLTHQMETELMKQLHDGARTAYSASSSSSSSSSYQSSYGGSNTGTSTNTGSRQVHRDSAEIDDLNRHGHRTSANYRPYTPSTDDVQRPERISYGTSQQPSSASQTTYGSNYGSRYGSTYETQSAGTARQTYDRDFPTLSSSQVVVNPSRTVTDVVQKVQNDLSEQIRIAIRTHQAKYSSSSYTMTNTRPDFQVALDDFKRDLRYNLTRKLNDELEHVYGRQDIRGEYSFSQNARNNANYRTADLDDLKKQAEDNLISYLETSFRSYETNYQSTRTQYTNSQRDYTRQGPQYTQSLTSDTAQNPNHVRYESGPYPGGKNSYRSQSSYSASSSYGSGDTQQQQQQQPMSSQLNQIKSQLQEDLQRQLQAAVYEQKSHSSYSTQSTGQVEQLLTDELKSNLTRRLQETLNDHYGKQGVRGGQSYTISASGVYYPNANYRTDDLNVLRQQLQEDLVRNLQEQLNQQSSSYSSYSASSSYAPSSSRYQGSTRFTNKPPSDMEGQVVDDMEGQQTIDDLGQQTEDLDSLVQKYTTFDEELDGASPSKPIRGDIGQAQTHLGQQNGEEFGTLELGSANRNKTNTYSGGQQIEDLNDLTDLTQRVEDDDFGLSPNKHYGVLEVASQVANKSMNYTQEIGQQTEELGQQLEDLDDLTQQTEDGFGHIDVASANSNYGNLQVGNQQVGTNYNKLKNRTQEIGQQTEDLGQQIEDLDGQTQQQIEDDYGPIQLGSSHGNNGNLQVGNQLAGNRKPQNGYGQTGQQQIEDDYEDIVLGIQPLAPTSTSTSTSTTTEYVPYGVYRNRHNSGSHVRPYTPYTPRSWQGVDSSFVRSTTSTTTQRSINVYAQNQEIDDFAAQLAETQQVQDGFNDFIDHGDFLQHVPQQSNVNDEDLTQQQQEENFDDLYPQPKPETPALSLSDVHRAYIGQAQYANSPVFNTNPQSRTIPAQSQVQSNRPTPRTYQSDYRPYQPEQEQDDLQQQQEIEPPLYMPAYQPRGRTYAAPEGPPQVEVIETSTRQTELKQEAQSSEGISEEEAVTEVVQPLGFWKRVGGKITNSFNTVKQKAKDLIST